MSVQRNGENTSPALIKKVIAHPYFPGILLFFVMLVIGLLVYKDFGMGWDDNQQRKIGLLNYDYIFNGSSELLSFKDKRYGPVYELVLIFFEKWFGLTDTRDVFLMRHLTTHIFFLISAFFLFVLAYRLFKNRWIALLGFSMLILTPRIYAHSFCNTKDIPFLSLFLVTLTVCQYAFEKKKLWLFFVVGILCGLTTSIRILGIMQIVFVVLFLIIDLVNSRADQEKIKRQLLNIALCLTGFCISLYISWPYIWTDPVKKIMESIHEFSHFDWDGDILMNGTYVNGLKLPWTYFPTWFLITLPELCISAGFAGIVWLSFDFVKKPFDYLKDSTNRNFLLYMACFFAPVATVILLHSVIYNDWRHLYFIYPSFLLIALYCINKLIHTRYKLIVWGACTLQLILAASFIVTGHPFEQVYFNNFVSHKNEYLLKNYEMDYLGNTYKQAMEHLLTTESGKIKVCCYYKILMDYNLMILPEEDRGRFEYTKIEQADFFFTNFYGKNFDCKFDNIEYEVRVLNSPVIRIYRVEKDTVSLKQYINAEIKDLKKIISAHPQDYNAYSILSEEYFSLGNIDSTELYAKQAFNLDTTNVNAINNLATIYGIEKKYSSAIQLNRTVIKMHPEMALPNTNVGLAYMYMGKSDSAIYYLKKAILVDPSYLPSYEIISIVYKAMQQKDSLAKYLQIAKKNNPAFNP